MQIKTKNSRTHAAKLRAMNEPENRNDRKRNGSGDENGAMTIQVQPMMLGKSSMTIPIDSTVDDLTTLLGEALRIDDVRMTLCTKEKILRKGLLRDHGIVNGSMVYLSILPRSGRTENQVRRREEPQYCRKRRDRSFILRTSNPAR